jgi:hypothetical protein
MKHRLLMAISIGLSLITSGAWAQATDISGTWTVSVDLPEENLQLALVLKQTGEKLTGTQPGGGREAQVTGSVKGDKVVFSVEGKNRSGEPFRNNYTGTIQSSTKMSGSAEFTKGSGKWTATKK